MKFKFIGVTLLASILLLGGVSAAADDSDETKPKKHDWQSEEATLSNYTFVSGGKAFMTIFSGISVSDTRTVWRDLQILRTQYPKIKEIELFLNSPGGSAFDGLALADLVEKSQSEWGFTINVWANGIIASAAVPVFAVCEDRSAAPSTIFMVHEAAIWKWPGRESASDIAAQNELMKLIKEKYIRHLVDNSILTEAEWHSMEGKTTWFSVDKAEEFGLLKRKVKFAPNTAHE